MNDSKIKVLLVEPEKYPKEIEIDDSLEAMQEYWKRNPITYRLSTGGRFFAV